MFLDCEFTQHNQDSKLVSLALVAESGEELYVELTDTYSVEDCSDFVIQNVLPQLDPLRYGQSLVGARASTSALAVTPMHIQGFPRGCCGIISELIGDYFNTLEVGKIFYVCGMKDGASHAWLEVDGLIVDVAGDQFPGRPSIYEWEEDTKHLVVHEPSAFLYGEERRFLERVLEQLAV